MGLTRVTPVTSPIAGGAECRVKPNASNVSRRFSNLRTDVQCVDRELTVSEGGRSLARSGAKPTSSPSTASQLQLIIQDILDTVVMTMVESNAGSISQDETMSLTGEPDSTSCLIDSIEDAGSSQDQANEAEIHDESTVSCKAASSPRMLEMASSMELEAAVLFARNKGIDTPIQFKSLSSRTLSEISTSPSLSKDMKVTTSSESTVGEIVASYSQSGEGKFVSSLWTNTLQRTGSLTRKKTFWLPFAFCLFVLLVALVSSLASSASNLAINPSTSNDSSTPSPTHSSFSPTHAPSVNILPTQVTYVPGELDHEENWLLLSRGLTSRVLAYAGKPVEFPLTNSVSQVKCHSLFDYGATFEQYDKKGEVKGWIYLSNAEEEDKEGGVGAFSFDAEGNLIDYQMLLNNTSRNCGGGRTPWESYISCEEVRGGRCYQVDPTGRREPQVITVGEDTDGGKFESFAHWTKNTKQPEFYVTEDDDNGTVRRFVPDDPNWSDPWSMLVGPGKTTHLLLRPKDMTFRWTDDVEEARINAGELFPGTEGIDEYGDRLYFVSKTLKKMVILNLLNGTYSEQSTKIGRFDGQPDQLVRFNHEAKSQSLFFTQDSDNACGISARNGKGMYTIVNTLVRTKDETAGLAFSPDGKHMYFAMQKKGILYDITRDDGLSFHSEPPKIRYEATADSDRF